jgi:ATP-dependent helicase HepA
MATEILARIPPDLDAVIERVVVSACARFGFTIERPRSRNVFAIELGHESLVESLPGVPAGATFVGTFSRERAVEDEALDFFASGHALVEGVLAHFDDSAIGRVTALELASGQDAEEGLIAFYRDGSSLDIVALDSRGRPRPEWAAACREHPLRARRIDSARTASPEWRAMIRRVSAQLEASRRPYALAGIVVVPRP